MEETGGMGSKRSKEKLSRQEIIKSLKCLDGVRTRKTAPSMAAWIMSLRVRSLRAYVITDILFAAPCWNLYRGCLGLEGRAFREVLFLNLAFGKGMF